MKLLHAEPTAEPAEGPVADEAEPAVRTCPTCTAAMDPAQDWCLECGTAAPGRLGGGAREAFRAASTVVGLTLLLVLGAVAASYAALTDDSVQIAKAPPAPAITPTVASTPAVPPVDEVPAPPADTLPEVELPEADASQDPDLPEPVPVTPPPSSSSSSPPVTPGTSAPSPPSTTPAEPAGPVSLALAEEAGSLFDPYGKAVESNETARALDGSKGTSWSATAAPDAEALAFGYAIEVKDPADVREVVLQTKTPGFAVEVYGTTSKSVPPDVLDDRWIHLRDRKDVDATVGGAPKDGNSSGDGEERITLGDNAEGKELRHVLLWFTQVPENGPTIRLTEIDLKA